MSRLFARRRLLAVGLTIALASPLAISTATAAHGGFETLRRGDSGPRVLLAQRVLDVDPRNGTFNDKTKRAVKRFQDRRGFAVTGVINERTFKALRTRWESILDARAKIDRKYSRIMKVARNQKGDPYVYGSAGPRAFDCSGLILYSYRQATGRALPHSSSA
jgi:cell wall-associated NlpC family hydrolase